MNRSYRIAVGNKFEPLRTRSSQRVVFLCVLCALRGFSSAGTLVNNYNSFGAKKWNVVLKDKIL
jgi:hypothetical protein